MRRLFKVNRPMRQGCYVPGWPVALFSGQAFRTDGAAASVRATVTAPGAVHRYGNCFRVT